MKKVSIRTFVLSAVTVFCFSFSLPAMAQAGFGKSEKFNDGWRFYLAEGNVQQSTGFEKTDFDDSKWRKLDVPHDWSIEGTPSKDLASCTGYLPGGVGWYRKHFKISDGQTRHFIYFEGVYNRSEVYLNGHLLGKRPNGYVSFMYELTSYLQKGENVLAVKVDHSKYADSRWYTGSGIYRDVYLVGSGDVHFSLWGVKADPQVRDGVCKLDVEAEIESGKQQSKNLTIKTELFDKEGNKIHESTSRGYTEKDGKMVLHTLGPVKNPELWSIESPNLYNMKVTLLDNGKVIDGYETRVGFRSLEFDANKGFALNGVNTKVKGVCLHHDAGVLGSVVPKDVWKRRLLALKEMGANAIRMSHNPQAPVLYDLCDEMGFLVMDEASDEWEFPKRKWVKGWNKGTPSYDGTYDFFEEWIDRDVADMVRRDRNHPCVFLWSVGNEVDYPNDPYSHPVLDGNNSKINQPMFGGYKPDAPNAERIGKIAKRLAAVIKKEDRTRPTTGALAGVVMSNETEYPEAVDIVGYNYTENRYEEDHKTYPNRILFGSETHSGRDAWNAVKNHEFIFGQFIWTGLDYLGESGEWPSRGLGTGLIDFTGFLKQGGLMMKSLWANETNSQQPAFNGQRQGRWGGMMVDDGSVRDGEVKELKVTEVTVDSDSPVKQLLVEAVDNQGKRIRNAKGTVVCMVKGKTRFLGLETANNRDMSAPKSNERELYQGRLLAYVEGNADDVEFKLVR